MRPAIVVTRISQLVEEGRELLAQVVESERNAAVRRMLMGRFLLKARAELPKRGERGDGWTAFLEAIEMDPETSRRYIALAEATLNLSERDSDKIPTYGDLGLDKRTGPEQPDPPPPTDEDAPPDGQARAPEVEIDRDAWCTPKEWAEAIGPVDYDPCSNGRSHVQAKRTFDLDLRGEDGLELVATVPDDELGFFNVPYSNVRPWVLAYRTKRFIFLLKFDPSTKWFGELIECTSLVLFPRGTRMEFEPPPGVVTSGSNPFPHALYFARAEDATDAIKALCFPGWTINRD